MVASQINIFSDNSSIFGRALSYINISGGGGSINLTVNSPDGLSINKSDQLFEVGASSAGTRITVTDSSVEAVVNIGGFEDDDSSSSNNLILGTGNNDYLQGVAGNDVLSGGRGNDTLVASSGIDTLTGGAGGDLFVLNTGNSNPQLADVITDFNAARGDRIGIVRNSIAPEDLAFLGFDSNNDGKLDATLVRYRNSFLGIVLGSLDANNKSTLEIDNFVPVLPRESFSNTNLSFPSIFS